MRKWADIATTAMMLMAASCCAMAADPYFSSTILSSALHGPVAMAFGPDGELYIAEKNGALRLFRDNELVDEPVFSMEVHTDSECGLLGLALHPDFALNGYAYLFATMSPLEQQIIRITIRQGRGEDPTVIRGFIPTVGLNHNGGCLRVGPDGKLYFSVGDNQNGMNAQQLATLAGKICRINLDGSTPEDNPFRTSTGFPRSVWASGFRNPFRFDVAPDGRLFVLDVGSDGGPRREEINIVRAGDNGGWPFVEGDFEPSAWPGFLRPAYTYREQGSAPAGACYYTGEAYPPEYRGNFFHADYVSNWVYRAQLDGDRVSAYGQLLRVDGGPVDLVQGPDGAIYYCSIISGDLGRIDYVGPPFHTDPPPEPPPEEPGSTENPGAPDSGVMEPPLDSDDGNSNDEPPIESPPTGLGMCGMPLAGLLVLGLAGMRRSTRLEARRGRRRRANRNAVLN